MITPFRCTIVRPDKYIKLNEDECFVEHDLTWLPKNIHAIHWYGSKGEIEYTNDYPEEIYSFSPYYQYVVNEINDYKKEHQKKIEEYKRLNYNPELLVRTRRNNLLVQSDWTQIQDAPLSEDQRKEWRIYRQKLRDLPNQISDFDLYAQDTAIWPDPPQ